jgi:hypothetical protein
VVVVKAQFNISRRVHSWRSLSAHVAVLFALVLSASPRPGSAQIVATSSSPIAHVRIDSLYGGRVLSVGEEENYRVRMAPNAAWPITYEWDMGDGVKSRGNNVVHRYERPGYYTLRVVAHNRYDSDSTYTVILVRDPKAVAGRVVIPAPPPVDIAEESRGSRQPRRTGDESETSVSDEYYSWMLESHFNAAAAQAALKRLRADGIGTARVFVDRSGGGSVAYRVLVGNYLSTGSAVADRPDIEAKVGRSVSLFTIR